MPIPREPWPQPANAKHSDADGPQPVHVEAGWTFEDLILLLRFWGKQDPQPQVGRPHALVSNEDLMLLQRLKPEHHRHQDPSDLGPA